MCIPYCWSWYGEQIGHLFSHLAIRQHDGNAARGAGGSRATHSTVCAGKADAPAVPPSPRPLLAECQWFNGLIKSVCSRAITASPHGTAGCIRRWSGWRESTGYLGSPVSPCHAPSRERAWFSVFPNKQLPSAAALAAVWRAHPLQEGPADFCVFPRGTQFRGVGNLSAMKGCSRHPSTLAITALCAACLPGLKPAFPLLLGSDHSYSPGRRQQPLTAGKLCCSLLQAAPDTACAQVLGFGVWGGQTITGSSGVYPENDSNALVEDSSDLPSL